MSHLRAWWFSLSSGSPITSEFSLPSVYWEGFLWYEKTRYWLNIRVHDWLTACINSTNNYGNTWQHSRHKSSKMAKTWLWDSWGDMQVKRVAESVCLVQCLIQFDKQWSLFPPSSSSPSLFLPPQSPSPLPSSPPCTVLDLRDSKVNLYFLPLIC